MKFFGSALALMLALCASVSAQERAMDAGSLAHALDRLGNTGRVLYVAAHPDDENTRLLAYLANARHLTVGYLSMTRGGGGQNLIGREQEELLDVVRTQELLAARALDGAQQRFSRMRDFGYSKTAAETLAVWDHDEALADVVWVIRTFQPDVVIARFDELPPNHGHHTASATLAREAFAAAADATRFPEQLALGAKPWQADRLLRNVSSWKKEPLPPDAITLDVGGYDARLGLSYGELAARSRTQHKSQGFGIQGERGELLESFVSVAGNKPTQDLLEGIDCSWARLGAAAAPVSDGLMQARKLLHRDHPESALPGLLAAYRALGAMADAPRVRDARAALVRVIAGASGLFVRASAEQPSAVAGQSVPLRVEVVLRRAAELTLQQVVFADGSVAVGESLAVDKKKEITRALRVPADAPVSTPYWLQERVAGRQIVRDATLVGQPEGPPPLSVQLDFTLGQQALSLSVPVLYVWTDRVHGERVRSFQIVPPATLTPEREAVLFVNGRSAAVLLRVRAGQDALSGNVQLNLPSGYRSKPSVQAVQLAHAGDEQVIRFDVTPPQAAAGVTPPQAAAGVTPPQAAAGVTPPQAAAGASIEIKPTLEVGGKQYGYRQDVIDYPHIPMQVVLRPARLRLTAATLSIPKGTVGYIEGSGDTLPSDLAHVGVPVVLLDDETLRSGALGRFSAIVVGIRAYNTRWVLRGVHPRLMRYVEEGGTLLVQYNTQSAQAPLDQPIGPYPLELGRDRVTDETARMLALDPHDPLLARPNKLVPADYAGWVQERGLYFAAKWDARYRPVLEIADPDEAPLRGGLLVAKHGRGRYVYTGLAFFRQLPAGVPGAYRLFMNLIAR